MKIEPRTLKGFRDFLPESAQKRQYVIETLRNVFQLYGFGPLETPTLEYEEILTGKYGEEGEKLMYRFEDHGKRRVAMRYDQTVPLARVIAQYQNEITFPFKRYQVQPVWRADNTQRGRFREFLQCDIDTVGTNSPTADAEILQVVEKAFENLGFKDFTILVNDRKNFENVSSSAILTIDKLKKIGPEEVKKELSQKGFDPNLLTEIENKPMTESLEQILQIANSKRIKYEPTLARGLDYYTGIIIEVEITGYSVGSVGGGGRYDTLIGMFAGKDIPAVGFAFGFDRIVDAMEELKLFPKELTSTKVLVTIFSEDLKQKSMEISSELRSNNITTEIYLDETAKMDKQLKYADKKKIPYVVIIGPDEAKNNTVTLEKISPQENKKLFGRTILFMSYPKSRPNRGKSIAYLAIIGSAIIWGATVPIMKLTLQNVPIFSLAFIRFFTAALILLPFVYKKLTIKPKDILMMIFTGLLGITFNILPFFYGLKLTSALNTGILISTAPLFTFVAAHIFLKEKVQSKTILGALIGFSGILIVMLDNTSSTFSISPQGDLLILASTFAFVAYEITSKKLFKKYNFLIINFYSFLVGSISFAPFAFREQQTNFSWITHLSFITLLGILFGIFFSSLLGYGLWQWGLSRIEASRAGVLMYLDPVVATVASVLILSERLTPLFLCGSAFIFLGLIVAGQNFHPIHRIFKKHQNL